MHQEGGNFYGTLETEEGIAHLTTIDVQDNRFKVEIASYTLNEQHFDAEISGDVESTNLNAKLILSNKSGTSLSFPLIGVRQGSL